MEQMEQTMEATQTTKKSGKKKKIVLGVIIFLLLGGLYTACESDPCSKAEKAVDGLGYKVLESKVMADVNSDMEAQGYEETENNCWYIAIKCSDDDSNIYTLYAIVGDAFSVESVQATIGYLGVEAASGTAVGLQYDDLPELTVQQWNATAESMDRLVGEFVANSLPYLQ